jgi:hypothetical protein
MQVLFADGFFAERQDQHDHYRSLAEATYRSALALFGNEPPPLGERDIRIERGGPLTHTEGVVKDAPASPPYVIQLALERVDASDEARLIFQLGHELGHVFLGPRRTNFVMESIASAVSLRMLSGFDAIRLRQGESPQAFRDRMLSGFCGDLPEEYRSIAAAGNWEALRPLFESNIKSGAEGFSRRSFAAEHVAGAAFLAASPPWSQFVGIAHRGRAVPDRYEGFREIDFRSLCSEAELKCLSRVGVPIAYAI